MLKKLEKEKKKKTEKKKNEKRKRKTKRKSFCLYFILLFRSFGILRLPVQAPNVVKVDLKRETQKEEAHFSKVAFFNELAGDGEFVLARP